MAVPPWTRELLNAGAVRQLQARANELLGELPVTAARGLDRVVRETRRGADQIRRWARRRTSLSAEVINGSGIFLHPRCQAPLSALQIDALAPMEESFTGLSGAPWERIQGRLNSMFQQRVGHGVLVARSFSAAITATSAAAPRGAAFALPRGAASRIDEGPSLPDLLAATGARVLEIGSFDRCDREDWLAARRGNTGPLVACGVRWPRATLHPHASDLSTCPADDEEIQRVQVLPFGGFERVAGLPEEAFISIDRESIAEHWLTILPGDRFMCGPRSGLILGSDAALEAVRSSSIWPVLAAGPGTAASLASTLEFFAPEHRTGLVLRSLLEPSVENLQSRCERLATQLAAEPSVTACQITHAPARLSSELSTAIPSRQLRIRPATGGGQAWARRLAEEVPSILVSPDGDSVVLDIRWVPAQVDGQLVSWIAGGQ